MDTHRAFSRHVALAVTILWTGLTACHSWTSVQTSPMPEDRLARAEHIRVFTKDGRQVDLRYEIRVTADSLVGYRNPPLPYNPEASGREAVALADIEAIEERRSRPVATTFLIVGGAVLLAGIVVGATWDGPLGNN